jgi:hypothetical protein
MSGFAPDYIQVNERIIAFRDRYPEGSLQGEIVELTETRVVMKGYAYRTPDDTRPGIGHSALEIPGKTPYTRGSEIENAETSAWGRALAALGFEVKRAIASAEEVASKAEEPQPIRRAPVALPPDPPMAEAVREDIWAGVPEEIRRPAVPTSPFYGWKVGERHDPTHNPLAYEPPPKNWFHCPTRVGEGWCQWRAKEHPKP